MTLDPNEVVIGTSRGVGLWVAPVGTPPPSGAAPFLPPWLPLGYASDDGITFSGDTTTETITPQQSRTPIRTLVTEKTLTVQFVMWQLNRTTLSIYFDTPVPAGQDWFAIRSDGGGALYAVGVDVQDGPRIYRTIYPRAGLGATGDLVLTSSAVVPLDVTLAALDDGGILSYELASTGAPGVQRAPFFTKPLPPTIERWDVAPYNEVSRRQVIWDAGEPPVLTTEGGRNSTPDPGASPPPISSAYPPGSSPWPFTHGFRWYVETAVGNGLMGLWPNQSANYMTGTVPQVGTRFGIEVRNSVGWAYTESVIGAHP
jgi:hypothetical protein